MEAKEYVVEYEMATTLDALRDAYVIIARVVSEVRGPIREEGERWMETYRRMFRTVKGRVTIPPNTV